MAARVLPAGWIVALLLALASVLLPVAAQADGHCDQLLLEQEAVVLHASLDVPGDGLPGDELHRQAPAKKRRPVPLLIPVLAPDVQDATWVLLTQPAGVDSVRSVPAPAAEPPRAPRSHPASRTPACGRRAPALDTRNGQRTSSPCRAFP
ncbi:hypothetical protein [Pseudoxanthomonas sp.]|uniref:hypothetical protein n=1 Tax=Pseudoxanthomonas sp. TaxID=1871049 RepID=UPI002588FE6F|nr:hypothetical protein [Pseudoxanthomonas sp.]KAF1695609.1 hypothetical protein CSC62_10730 [Pseudoxanthomonas jiangsuensis]MCR6685138.1 hypothetical protein [Pseudoxanthomonas sp.]